MQIGYEAGLQLQDALSRELYSLKSYMRTQRRQRHREEWEKIRKRRTKRVPQSITIPLQLRPDTPPPDALVGSVSAVSKFCSRLTVAFKSLVDPMANAWSGVRAAGSSCLLKVCRRQVPKPPTGSRPCHARKRRAVAVCRRIPRSSIGAGLARWSAVRRGASLAPWRTVCEKRRAWLWAQRWPGSMAVLASSVWHQFHNAAKNSMLKPRSVLRHDVVLPHRVLIKWNAGCYRGVLKT